MKVIIRPGDSRMQITSGYFTLHPRPKNVRNTYYSHLLKSFLCEYTTKEANVEQANPVGANHVRVVGTDLATLNVPAKDAWEEVNSTDKFGTIVLPKVTVPEWQSPGEQESAEHRAFFMTSKLSEQLPAFGISNNIEVGDVLFTLEFDTPVLGILVGPMPVHVANYARLEGKATLEDGKEYTSTITHVITNSSRSSMVFGFSATESNKIVKLEVLLNMKSTNSTVRYVSLHGLHDLSISATEANERYPEIDTVYMISTPRAIEGLNYAQEVEVSHTGKEGALFIPRPSYLNNASKYIPVTDFKASLVITGGKK